MGKVFSEAVAFRCLEKVINLIWPTLIWARDDSPGWFFWVNGVWVAAPFPNPYKKGNACWGKVPQWDTCVGQCVGSVSKQGWPQSTVLAVPSALGKQTYSAWVTFLDVPWHRGVTYQFASSSQQRQPQFRLTNWYIQEDYLPRVSMKEISLINELLSKLLHFIFTGSLLQ